MLCNKVVSLNLSVVGKDTEKEIKLHVIAEIYVFLTRVLYY